MISLTIKHSDFWGAIRYQPSHQVLVKGTDANGKGVEHWVSYAEARRIDEIAYSTDIGIVTLDVEVVA